MNLDDLHNSDYDDTAIYDDIAQNNPVIVKEKEEQEENLDPFFYKEKITRREISTDSKWDKFKM